MNPEIIQRHHNIIASYYAEKPLYLDGADQQKKPNARKLAEEPWQLLKTKHWQRLFIVISNLHFLKAAVIVNENDVRIYWSSIERNSNHRLIDAYREVIENPGIGSIFFLNEIVGLLYNFGYLEEALKGYSHLADYYHSVGNVDAYGSVLSSKALIFRRTKSLVDARNVFDEVASLYRKTNNQNGLQKTLFHEALICVEQGDTSLAKHLLDDVEQICRSINNYNGLAYVILEKARIQSDEGDFEKCLVTCNESERIGRVLKRPEIIMVSNLLKAKIYNNAKDWKSAKELFESVVDMARQYGSLFHLSEALIGLCSVLIEYDQKIEVDTLLQEALSISKKSNNKLYLAQCLFLQGLILIKHMDTEAALNKIYEAVDLFTLIDHRTGLTQTLVKLTQIYNIIGKTKEAKDTIDRVRVVLGKDFYYESTPLAREALRIWRLLNRK